MSRASTLTIVVVIVAMCFVVSTPSHARSAAVPALPSDAELRTETLLDATIDALPPGFSTAGVQRWALRPSPQPLVVPLHEGRLFILVESGKLTATQSGVETLLLAGEVFAPASQDHDIALRVSGGEDAIVFVVSLSQRYVDPICYETRDPQIHTSNVLIQSPAGTLPNTFGRLVLERLTLPLGGTQPPQEANPLVWTGVGSGLLGLTLAGQMPFLWEPGQERTIHPGQPWPQIPGPTANPLTSNGTEMALRNVGKDPLVLYRLTLMPRIGGVAAPTDPLSGPPLV